MAENHVDLPLDVFSNNMKALQLELRAQGLVKEIRNFEGEGSRRFTNWLKDMERVGKSVGADDERMRALALQTLQGTAASFLLRKIRDNAAITWEQVKTALKKRFSDLGDTDIAKQALRGLRQHKGESVENFAQRIMDFAEDAYPENELDEDLIQSHLCDIFMDGLLDDSTAKKLYRTRPATLDDAVKVAVKDQQANKAFNLRRFPREEEEMEVDTLDVSRLSNLEYRFQSMEEKLDKLLASKTSSTGKETKKFQHEWTNDGKPICAYCKKVGHVIKKCHKKARDDEPKNQSASN